MKCGTWKVRSLYLSGALKCLLADMGQYKMNIIAIQGSLDATKTQRHLIGFYRNFSKNLGNSIGNSILLEVH